MTDDPRFARVFEELVPRLRSYARYRGLRADDADDLVAATLEVAWRRRADLPSDDPLPWLFGVERNLLRNRRRSDARRHAFLRRLPAPDGTASHESDAPDVTAIRAALASLGEGDREILTLIAWDGLTPSQAARVLGCSDVAARSRLHRARRRLAGELRLDDELQRPIKFEQLPGDSSLKEAPRG